MFKSYTTGISQLKRKDLWGEALNIRVEWILLRWWWVQRVQQRQRWPVRGLLQQQELRQSCRFSVPNCHPIGHTRNYCMWAFAPVYCTRSLVSVDQRSAMSMPPVPIVMRPVPMCRHTQHQPMLIQSKDEKTKTNRYDYFYGQFRFICLFSGRREGFYQNSHDEFEILTNDLRNIQILLRSIDWFNTSYWMLLCRLWAYLEPFIPKTERTTQTRIVTIARICVVPWRRQCSRWGAHISCGTGIIFFSILTFPTLNCTHIHALALRTTIQPVIYFQPSYIFLLKEKCCSRSHFMCALACRHAKQAVISKNE